MRRHDSYQLRLLVKRILETDLMIYYWVSFLSIPLKINP